MEESLEEQIKKLEEQVALKKLINYIYDYDF